MKERVAYLAAGKVNLLEPGEEKPRVFESKFGQEVRERAVSIQRRHSWKQKGRGAQFMSGGLLWGGAGQDDPGRTRILMQALAQGQRPGEFLYALDTDEVGGVFAVELDGGEERRLFHSADVRVEHLAAAPDQERLACAVKHNHGVANIAVMQSDGSDLTEVTEGDSMDLAPAWIPGRPGELVLQSAGVARDGEGSPMGLGPFAVQRLDLRQGDLEELTDDEEYDHLGPRVTEDGAVYCIRRPYKSPDTAGSPLRAMLDFLLFPFRLLFALFSWLNFFTARYTGKPLTTAGGPKKQGADIKQMMVWGNLIDVDEDARKAHQAGDDTPALVPASWQLVKLADGDGKPEVLAKGVLSYDLCADGAVVYTNGAAIYRLAPDGSRERLHKAEEIQQVAVLEPAPPDKHGSK